MPRRFLPQYVASFKDRHGKERLRFRRKGYATGYFRSPLGTEEFRVEYRAFMDGPQDPVATAIERAAPGTIDDLITRYFAVPERLGPSPATQAKIRAILDRFRTGRKDRMVRDVTFEHIDAIVARARVKRQVGKRMQGGVEAARKLRKELMRLFDFAVKIRMRPDNPVRSSDRIKTAPSERTTGFHTWSEEEITQYRGHHKLGTRARLAMELMLWSGQRRIDAIRLGRQHIRNGRFEFSQSKGGKALGIPVAPQLVAAIVAMPASAKAHLCFLTTDQGRPYTNPGFGNWFREQCDAAGLPQCTAHGLRKATMRRMAELHFGNQTLKSVSGHSGDDEVATYTRAVDQRRMADDAIAALSRWEVSNLSPRLDTSSAENG